MNPVDLESLSNEELVKLIPSLDCSESAEASFEILHERLTGRLQPVARRTLNHRHDVEDCVNQTLMALFSKFKNPIELRTSVEVYAISCCKNLAIDILRKEQRRNRNRELYARDHTQSSPEDEAIRTEQRERVRQAIEDRLSGLQREIVEEHYFNGKEYKQIAENMDLTVPSVQSHSARARGELRDELREGEE